MFEFAFVVEQVLGHITHGHNLREHVSRDEEIRSHWVLPAFDVSGWRARVPVYRSNWTVRSGLAARRGLRAMSRSTQLDALFIHTQVPAMLCPDWLRRVPSVLSVDATPRQYDELGSVYEHRRHSGPVEALKLRTARSRFSAADHLITWSDWAKRGLVDDYGVAGGKITVIPPGVAVADWMRPTPRRNSDATTKLLFVGGDLERKGGHVLLEAFRSLAHLDVELHLVTRDDVKVEPGVVVHRGLQPNSAEIRHLYHECDVFVLPTLGDTLGIVLSEAGAAAMASVSTPIAAIPEVVLDGETGLLVPPGDVGALANALERLISRPEERHRMGERAALHIARHYDTAANTVTLLEIMKRISRRSRS